MGSGGAEHRERFEAAHRELDAPICGYVLQRVREPEDAAEVIAETFAALWRAASTPARKRRVAPVDVRRGPAPDCEPAPRRPGPPGRSRRP